MKSTGNVTLRLLWALQPHSPPLPLWLRTVKGVLGGVVGGTVDRCRTRIQPRPDAPAVSLSLQEKHQVHIGRKLEDSIVMF